MIVGILGLGLIGGSMARAYALEGHTVYAADKDEQILPAMRIMKDSTVVISII